jgi:hypothetical protein
MNNRPHRWRYGGSWLLVLGLPWLAVWGAAILRAADGTDNGAMAKSMVLFSDYIKWPAAENSDITIGILGDDPFGETLAKVNVKRSRKLDDLKGCQIIFVSKSEQGNLNAILDALGTASVLTVGDAEGFAKQGGVIGFVAEGDKVRFEINTAAARRAGLRIDLRLLKLAMHVFNS